MLRAINHHKSNRHLILCERSVSSGVNVAEDRMYAFCRRAHTAHLRLLRDKRCAAALPPLMLWRSHSHYLRARINVSGC
jgi:hypothetical protein